MLTRLPDSNVSLIYMNLIGIDRTIKTKQRKTILKKWFVSLCSLVVFSKDHLFGSNHTET